MKKDLKKIINKLNRQPVFSLTSEEIGLYFAHRLDKLLHDKKVLTRNELIYLLSETGPGNRRIDPRLVTTLVYQDVIVSSIYESFPEIIELKDKKKKVEKYVLDHKKSKKTNELITRLIKKYLKNLKNVSFDPLIIKGTFKDLPVACYIKNGDWILPNEELFSFLQIAQTQKRFPIIIAKKISGILFPVFKGLSILGLNLYKTFLPEKAVKNIANCVYKPKESFLQELKYNGQFQFLTSEYLDNTQDEYGEGDSLKNFFEKVVPENIKTYCENFLNQKISIADNFIDTVSQFRKNKATQRLLDTYKAQEKIIIDITLSLAPPRHCDPSPSHL